jgi:hypothetical protein
LSKRIEGFPIHVRLPLTSFWDAERAREISDLMAQALPPT